MDKIDKLSETIERSALESLHLCCPEDIKQALGLDLVEVEDSIVACCTRDPSILINRTLGLGSKTPVTRKSIEAITAEYSQRDIKNYFIHIYEETLNDECREYLNSDAFVKKRGWMKFTNINPESISAETELRVEQISANKGNDFGKIVCKAFGLIDESIPVLSGLVNDDRWKLFVSYDDDVPAGAGALFVEGNSGWLEWGATLPEFRRRGSQAAIMALRIDLAQKLGCEYLFTETGEEVEGDPQHSYKNILKAGFEESVLRLNFSPNI